MAEWFYSGWSCLNKWIFVLSIVQIVKRWWWRSYASSATLKCSLLVCLPFYLPSMTKKNAKRSIVSCVWWRPVRVYVYFLSVCGSISEWACEQSSFAKPLNNTFTSMETHILCVIAIYIAYRVRQFFVCFPPQPPPPPPQTYFPSSSSNTFILFLFKL